MIFLLESIRQEIHHKHQDLSIDDKTRGLSRMTIDITKAFLRKMATQGYIFTEESFRTLKATYYRKALEYIDIYKDDATINGLTLDINLEERTVELFAENIINAGKSGYKTFDEFLTIYHLLGKYNFQEIIFLNGFNDFLSLT